MILTARANGFVRTVPLHNNSEYQTSTQISLADVPPLSVTAVVGKVTQHSIRYDDGLSVWYVDRFDKTIIRGYREYRSQDEVDAGAFPIIAWFNDDRGQF